LDKELDDLGLLCLSFSCALTMFFAEADLTRRRMFLVVQFPPPSSPLPAIVLLPFSDRGVRRRNKNNPFSLPFFQLAFSVNALGTEIRSGFSFPSPTRLFSAEIQQEFRSGNFFHPLSRFF